MEAIMKVGPKGQVVIPQDFRHALNIYPGSKVLFRMVDNRLEMEYMQQLLLLLEQKQYSQMILISMP